MKKITIFLLIFAALDGYGQVTTSEGSFNRLTVGGVPIVGFSTELKDSLRQDMGLTPFLAKAMIALAVKNDTGTVFRDNSWIGTGRDAGDPVRINWEVNPYKGGVAAVPQKTLAEVRAARPAAGVLIWLKDSKVFMYSPDGVTMRYLNSTLFK